MCQVAELAQAQPRGPVEGLGCRTDVIREDVF